MLCCGLLMSFMNPINLLSTLWIGPDNIVQFSFPRIFQFRYRRDGSDLLSALHESCNSLNTLCVLDPITR